MTSNPLADNQKNSDDHPGFHQHPRTFLNNQLVYPVLSRRSGGISVGINLNPRQNCNFNCLYCQVHRRPDSPPPAPAAPDLDIIRSELIDTCRQVHNGDLFRLPAFRDVPKKLRRLNDIALSGDGEPTASPVFTQACTLCAQVRRELNLTDVKIILLTNATLLHQPPVQQGLNILDQNNGEIWAKLDAGTESYYQTVNRSAVPFSRILDNLLLTALARPIVIQTLILRVNGSPPPRTEILAYAQHLNNITSAGGTIKYIQLHTLARPPQDTRVTKVSRAELQHIAELIRQQTSLPVNTYL